MILKNKFLILSTPDIRRKLQKLKADSDKSSLDQLIQAANALYYKRDLEKERQKNRCHNDVLTTIMHQTQGKMQSQGSAATVRDQTIFWRECSRIKGQESLPRPCPTCKEIIGNHDAFGFDGSWGSLTRPSVTGLGVSYPGSHNLGLYSLPWVSLDDRSLED